MNRPTVRQIRYLIKPAWFVLLLLPLLWLMLNAFELAGPGLGADPIEAIQDEMGIWGLRILLLTLAITPLRTITGQTWLTQLRRMTGLYVLFYAALHFLNYLVLDQGAAWAFIIEDILERPFITIGAAALLCLLPLGITSTVGWRRKLGKRWQRLHQLIYVIAPLVCWHFWWQVKQDITEPAIYAAVLAILLTARLPTVKTILQRQKKPAPESSGAGNQ